MGDAAEGVTVLAKEPDELKANLVGPIEVTAEFRGAAPPAGPG
jgi:hypothetical protein